MDSPFVKIAVPVVGNLLGIAMLGSPMKAVWQIRKTGLLGDINPLPYPLTCVNSLSWIIYGAVVHDPFIPPANIFGLTVGILFTMTVLPMCTKKMQDIMQGILAFVAVLFGILSMVSTLSLDNTAQKQMWGIIAILCLMTYYLIPLSTMYEIIKTRDASSIYLPLAIAAITNGGLWTTYGLAIGDINVWGPNAFGVLMAAIQIVLRLLLRVKQRPQDTKELATTNGHANGDVTQIGTSNEDLKGLLEQQLAETTLPVAAPPLDKLSRDWPHTPKHEVCV